MNRPREQLDFFPLCSSECKKVFLDCIYEFQQISRILIQNFLINIQLKTSSKKLANLLPKLVVSS